VSESDVILDVIESQQGTLLSLTLAFIFAYTKLLIKTRHFGDWILVAFSRGSYSDEK
jgi:hypothetical protein